MEPVNKSRKLELIAQVSHVGQNMVTFQINQAAFPQLLEKLPHPTRYNIPEHPEIVVKNQINLIIPEYYTAINLTPAGEQKMVTQIFLIGDKITIHEIRELTPTKWAITKATLSYMVPRNFNVLGIVRLKQTQPGEPWTHCYATRAQTHKEENLIRIPTHSFSKRDRYLLKNGDFIRFDMAKILPEGKMFHEVNYAQRLSLEDVENSQYNSQYTHSESLKQFNELWGTIVAADFMTQMQQLRSESLPSVTMTCLNESPPFELQFTPLTLEGSTFKAKEGMELHIEPANRAAKGLILNVIVHEIEYENNIPLITIILNWGQSLQLANKNIDFTKATFRITERKDPAIVKYIIETLDKITFGLNELGTDLTTKQQILLTLMAAYTLHTPNISVDPNIMNGVETEYPPTIDLQTILTMVLKEELPLLLLEGPPGSAKTTTIGIIVQQLLKKYPGMKILLCAPSNKAADYLAQSVQNNPHARPVRIYARHQEAVKRKGKINKIALHTACNTFSSPKLNSLKQQQTTLTQKLREAIESGDQTEIPRLLEQQENLTYKKQTTYLTDYNPNVFITTCMGSLDSRISQIRFAVIIIDEAGQANRHEVVMAATKLKDKDAKHFILVGDPKQLPPTIISMGLIQQIGEESALAFLKRKSLCPSYTMTHTFRMHPDILELPNQIFYNNLLTPSVTREERNQLLTYYPWPNPTIPLAFIHHNYPEGDRIGFSKQNPGEAQIVAKIVKHFYDQGIPLMEMAILTFYEAQRAAILQALPNTLTEDISVNNVDSFQGEERKLIILSCVRSKNSKERNSIGFLKDYRRVNVALTRAREGLIVIGNANVLQQENPWKQIINFLIQRRNILI